MPTIHMGEQPNQVNRFEYDIQANGPLIASGPALFDQLAPEAPLDSEGASNDPAENIKFLTDQFKHSNKALSNKLLKLGRGEFLLDPSEFQELHDSDHPEAAMRALDDFYYGRHKNTHNLEFGQLSLTTDQDVNRQIFISLKPFDTPKKAAHEFITTGYVNSFASDDRPLPSFRPLGFYRDPKNGQFCMLTEYDERVQSFDNIFWNIDKDPTSLQIEKALSRCALSLFELHSMGLSHGDAQVKNLASDNNGVRFIDLEEARLHELDANEAASRMLDDLDAFFASLSTGGAVELGDYLDRVLSAVDQEYVARVNRAIEAHRRVVPESWPTLDMVEERLLTTATYY